MSAGFVLVVDGREIKRFPTKLQCVTEAYERGFVLQWGADFAGDKPGKRLRDGVSIVAIEEMNDG